MRRILLFDIDGTIAESSKSVGLEMKTAIRKKVVEGWDVGIVGGGKLDKALSQLGDLEMNHYFTECGCVYHRGRELKLIHIRNIREHTLYTKINVLIKKALYYLSQVDYILTGNFVDLRSGIIYISLIGMTATHEERTVFIELDRQHNYRKELIAILKATAQEIGILDDVVISEGGMVGIGLYPREYDKVQVVECVRDAYDEIHYFGDKYETDGNDYHLLHHESVIGHNVDSVEDTLRELQKL
jgi:phosphomannomutase